MKKALLLLSLFTVLLSCTKENLHAQAANVTVDFRNAGYPCHLTITDEDSSAINVCYSEDYSEQYIYLSPDHLFTITITYENIFPDSNSYFMWAQDGITAAEQFNLGGTTTEVTMHNIPFKNLFSFGSSGR